MDFDLTDVQAQLSAAVEELLERYGERHPPTLTLHRPDTGLLAALRDGGYLDLLTNPDAGGIEAALVTERAGYHLAPGNVGARAFVLPCLNPSDDAIAVAVTIAGQPWPVRLLEGAQAVVVIDGKDCRVARQGDFEVEPVASRYGFGFARLRSVAPAASVFPESANQCLTHWRIAVAAELVGLMGGAVDHVLAYLVAREQFGRPIASFQVVQHRLVNCSLLVEGTRWLARHAAFTRSEADGATALYHGALAAREVVDELHQLTGAVGFTNEFGLSHWTMRIEALRAECGSLADCARHLVSVRWEGARA